MPLSLGTCPPPPDELRHTPSELARVSVSFLFEPMREHVFFNLPPPPYLVQRHVYKCCHPIELAGRSSLSFQAMRMHALSEQRPQTLALCKRALLQAEKTDVAIRVKDATFTSPPLANF